MALRSTRRLAWGILAVMMVAAMIAMYFFTQSKASHIEPEDLGTTFLFQCVLMPMALFLILALFLTPRRTKNYDYCKVTLAFHENEVFAEFHTKTQSVFSYHVFKEVLTEGDVVYFVGSSQPIIADLSVLNEQEKQDFATFLQRRFG
ncbi:MAG: hypothetical protein IJB27_03470 [Clostridia bacterium]|nr:hypothetical protein [Clostridia bacterium]